MFVIFTPSSNWVISNLNHNSQMGWKVQNHQLVHFARVCNCPVITFLVQYPEANKHSKGIPPRSIGHNYIYKRWMFHCYVRSREGCWWIMPPAAATLILPPVVPFFFADGFQTQNSTAMKAHWAISWGSYCWSLYFAIYKYRNIYIYMVICILIVDAAIYTSYTLYTVQNTMYIHLFMHI